MRRSVERRLRLPCVHARHVPPCARLLRAFHEVGDVHAARPVLECMMNACKDSSMSSYLRARLGHAQLRLGEAKAAAHDLSAVAAAYQVRPRLKGCRRAG